ncbi:MAG: peptide-methionine (S)-S-oxide reductase MsrA [Leptolyngbyaceae cyanobacterium SM1_3_5]|nr:peptide-methionine (S)-S-oxide reductase MsrA [Leptolyngbyaceae cyanobacterium SM1_3_5]
MSTFSRFAYSLAAISIVAVTIAGGVLKMPLPGLATNDSHLISATSFPDPAIDIEVNPAVKEQTIVLAGGCFWGVEAVFEHLKGVSDVTSGYMGGDEATANYPRVSTGTTAHAESVKITYDSTQISYEQLLKVFFVVAHNPTELDRQGPDTGTQYRSAIFGSDEQQRVAQVYIDQLNAAKVFDRPIVTEIASLSAFYPAEEHHQNFIDRNPNYPYVVVHDLPKLDRLREQFPNLYQ